MKVARTKVQLDAALARRGSSVVGLVPTMGAFHSGHEMLFAAARQACDLVVVSLFVNPAQFDSPDDLARYPRDEAADAGRAEAAGVDVLFTPAPAELYPDGFQTWVEVTDLGRPLEGEFRPGHFRGVATVCLKLFNLVQPAVAFFGEKDAQQAAVVKQLVRDLDVPVEIRVLPTVRDEDGLALSSRNAQLGGEHRRAAAAIPRALAAGAAAHARGEDAAAAAQRVLDEEALVVPQYVEVARLNGRVYLLAAARVGGVRLIDNVVLEGDTT